MDNDRQNYGQNRSPLRMSSRGVYVVSDQSQQQNRKRPMSNHDEEEEVNRRRQESIRAPQMQTQFLQPQVRPQSANIVSQDSHRFNERTSLREQPPTSHFTLGRQPAEQQTPLVQVPLHIKEHISHIQNDNASLMRRLNLVHQELDRIIREKGDLQSQLTHWMKQSTESYDLLNKDDNVDRVNKYMKDDLMYEQDRNQKLKFSIQELNTQILNMADEIRQLERDQELMIRQNQENTYILQKQVIQVSDLEKEQFFNQERIKEAHLSIDQSKGDNQDLDQDKYQIRQNIELAMVERNALIERVSELARQFDMTVQDITVERRILEEQNSNHAKFVTSKIILNQLHAIYQAKLLAGFQEIVSYNKFDSKCNQKMKSLANLLEKAGTTKLKISLTHWFSTTLKPVNSMHQSIQLSRNAGGIKFTSKYFRLWRNAFLAKIQTYESKTQAVQKIWARFTEEATKEKQRSFRIWKEQFSKLRLQQFRLRRIIWNKNSKQVIIAVSAWKSQNSYYESQLRLGMLIQNFSHQQYLAIMFRSFHQSSQHQKRKRVSKLSHCVKAWKDYLSYQKYLMSQNLLASRFHSECKISLVKSCLDAIKNHKQRKLLSKAHQNLHSDELIRIHELNEGNRFLKEQRYRLNLKRACDSIKTSLEKRLWSYISHWRSHNLHYHDSVATSIKDKIIKHYMVTIRVAFTRMKLLHGQNKTLHHTSILQSKHSEQKTLQNSVYDITNINTDKNDEIQYQRQRHLLKCIEGFEQRLQHIAVGRWRDQVSEKNIKETGAYTIMRRLRLRYLRKTIDLYIDGVDYQKKVETQEKRCAQFKKTRENRVQALIMNSWVIFKSNHQRAKDYWYRIFLRLDLSMKRQSIKKWKEVAQLSVEQSLQQHESSIVDTIDELNHTIGQTDQQDTEQKQVIEYQVKTLTTQGQRILSNAFARFYYINQTRGIEKWKEFVVFERNRQRLLEKAAAHIKKSQFYVVKCSFKNWLQNCNILERKEQLKRETMKVNDTIFQTNLKEENFNSSKTEFSQHIQEEIVEQHIANQKLQKTVKLIVKTVNKNHYTSQRRFIFQQWSDYVRREVYFINCIKNVLQKSLWNDGFQSIKNFSREEQKDSCRLEVLSKFFTSVKRRVTLNSFSRWQTGNYTLVKQVTSQHLNSTEVNIERHETQKDKVKTFNALRAEKMIRARFMKSMIHSWYVVGKNLKLEKEKSLLCQNEIDAFRSRQALAKWRSRNQTTKVRRTAFNRLSEKLYQMRLKVYFNSMQTQFYQSKELIARLSNLATVLDHHQFQAGFAAIQSYSKAKYFVHDKRKENSSIWFAESLASLFQKKKNTYLSELRHRCINKRKIETIKKFTVAQNMGKQMRAYFQNWKVQSEKVTLSKELYEEGPVREQEFLLKSELKNIKEFMNGEGYDEQDIHQALAIQNERQRGLLLKVVRRMQHFNSSSYLKPKMFDRWRQYIHMKKLFRYWLGFVDKRAELVKSDLHQAFDKWKNYHSVKHQKLTVQSKEQLNLNAVKNSKKLDVLSSEITDKENIIDHLNAQRETLLDNYIKAQKLALSLWVNRQRNCIHQAFLKWSDGSKEIRNNESADLLKKNLNTMEMLKQRILEFETVNESLANENEELRQFSLDGYDIAKNVQILSAEREILSVDLADKAQVIRQLLDENEALTRKLQKAQEQAQTMIRSTMRRDRCGSVGFQANNRTIRS